MKKGLYSNFSDGVWNDGPEGMTLTKCIKVNFRDGLWDGDARE